MTGGGWVVGTVMVSDKSKSGLSSQSPGRLPRTHVCSKLQVTPSQRARCFTYGSSTRVRAAVSGAGRKQVVVVRNVFAPSPLIPSLHATSPMPSSKPDRAVRLALGAADDEHRPRGIRQKRGRGEAAGAATAKVCLRLPSVLQETTSRRSESCSKWAVAGRSDPAEHALNAEQAEGNGCSHLV